MATRRDHSHIELSLEPDLERFVAEKVEAGQYRDGGELVRDLLRALRDHDDAMMPTDTEGIARLRGQLDVGLDELDRGEGIRLNHDTLKSFFDDVIVRGMARRASTKPL